MEARVSPEPEPAVLFERAGAHVALVTINRPAVRNAVNAAVAQALDAIVRQTEADPEIWAVVLTGAGEAAFCAGADLKEVSAGAGAALWTEGGGFAGFVFAPRTKLWIAAVNGAALAGGTEIALACDLVVAAESASFGLPEVKRGLIAAAGGLYRLPRALPRAIALELIATGGRIDARRAHHFGMVNRLAPAAAARSEAMALAEMVCENAPIAVRESLQVARRAVELEDAELRRLSEEARTRVMQTEDYREGPRAFIEKRPPVWRGR
jgi:enoyl-CoA hydratase/carnithine racemase